MPKKFSTTTTSAKDKTVSAKKFETVNSSKFTGKGLSDGIIGQLIVDLQHNLRRSTAHTKTRGEVQGSTRKPWRQKGTGRARVGTRQTPVWRGGGRVFGPRTERNFTNKINKKLISPALITVLQKKADSEAIFTMSQTFPENTKTSNVAKFFQGILDAKSNLIIIPKRIPALEQATKNIKYITIRQLQHFNLLDVAKHRHIIFMPNALDELVKRIS